MSTKQRNAYCPDYVVPPGQILEEHLEARGIKKTTLAALCGLTGKTISQIISGKAPVTADLALQLQRILGTSAELWCNLEANYRLDLARQQERKKLTGQEQWAKAFPIVELVRRGVMAKPETPAGRAAAVLAFFGAGSPAAWDRHYAQMAVNFRRSATLKSNEPAVAAWLRIGELRAKAIAAPAYDETRFKEALTTIREMTAKVPADFSPRLRKLCLAAGVVLVFEPELKGTSLSGATRWLKDTPLIMLSLRHKSDDHFWFSFFHEAGHIIRHGKKLTFIDLSGQPSQDPLEQEADQFAADFLISPKGYAAFVAAGQFSEAAIQRFAKEAGIAAGIVVGRLQNDKKLPWGTPCNRLKRKVDFAPKA